MGVETAALAFSVGSSLYASQEANSARRKQIDATRISDKQTKADLAESKKKIAIGMTRARAAGTNRIFKEGPQASANPNFAPVGPV